MYAITCTISQNTTKRKERFFFEKTPHYQKNELQYWHEQYNNRDNGCS